MAALLSINRDAKSPSCVQCAVSDAASEAVGMIRPLWARADRDDPLHAHYCAPPSKLRDARSIQACSWLVGKCWTPGPALALVFNAIEDDVRTTAAARVFAIFVNMVRFL